MTSLTNSLRLLRFAAELFDHYVLAWKRNIAVLTAGNVKVTMNPRIRLMPHQLLPGSGHATAGGATAGKGSTYNLEIQNVRGSDAGEYACQVGTLVPKEIVHRLEVLGTYANATVAVGCCRSLIEMFSSKHKQFPRK